VGADLVRTRRASYQENYYQDSSHLMHLAFTEGCETFTFKSGQQLHHWQVNAEGYAGPHTEITFVLERFRSTILRF
jgi:hypothetical protein